MTCTPWPVPDPLTCDVGDLTPADITEIAQAAQTLLAALSAGRVGECEITNTYRMPWSGMCPVPYKSARDGQWRNGPEYAHNCCRVLLSGVNPHDVSEVKVWGEVAAPESYILEGNDLMSLGGCWPSSDECDEPALEVTYKVGLIPGKLAELAMGELLCDLISGVNGGVCHISGRATNVTRQGVSIQKESVSELLKSGYTGLGLVDAFIRQFNPQGFHAVPRVVSPDVPLGQPVERYVTP